MYKYKTVLLLFLKYTFLKYGNMFALKCVCQFFLNICFNTLSQNWHPLPLLLIALNWDLKRYSLAP